MDVSKDTFKGNSNLTQRMAVLLFNYIQTLMLRSRGKKQHYNILKLNYLLALYRTKKKNKSMTHTHKKTVNKSKFLKGVQLKI